MIKPPSDTQPKIEKMLIEARRNMTVAERFHHFVELNRFVEILALADIRRRYPDADEYECRLRLASHRIPADLMKKAFGWDPEEKGY